MPSDKCTDCSFNTNGLFTSVDIVQDCTDYVAYSLTCMQGKDWLSREQYDREQEELVEDDEMDEEYSDHERACEMRYQRLAAIHVHWCEHLHTFHLCPNSALQQHKPAQHFVSRPSITSAVLADRCS